MDQHADSFNQISPPRQTARSLARAQKLQGVVVRPFMPDDWSQLKDLMLASIDEYDTPGPGQRGLTRNLRDLYNSWAPEQWGEFLSTNKNCFYGAFINGEAVGRAAIFCDQQQSNTAHVEDLWVRPEWRGKGLPDKMFETVYDWLKENPDIRYLVTSHLAGNVASKAANQRLGFTYDHKTGSREGEQKCYRLAVAALPDFRNQNFRNRGMKQ